MYYISNQTNVHVTLDGKKNGVKMGVNILTTF